MIVRLCARPDVPDPTANYARLCMAFIGAKVLQHGRVTLADYRGEALTDPVTHDLARLFEMEMDANPDENAMVPHELVVRMKDGSEHPWRCEAILASPERRLSRDRHIAKFRDCCLYAAVPLAGERLIEAVDCLESVADVRDLVGLLAP